MRNGRVPKWEAWESGKEKEKKILGIAESVVYISCCWLGYGINHQTCGASMFIEVYLCAIFYRIYTISWVVISKKLMQVIWSNFVLCYTLT